jgi:hypothetical protein
MIVIGPRRTALLAHRNEGQTVRLPLRLALQVAGAALLVVASATTAVAHAELESSSPAAGANLDSPPDEVALTFSEELDPDASSFTVTDAHGVDVGTGSVDLDVADRNVVTGEVAIDEPGIYTVAYTVTSVDGHEVSGSFGFGFDSDEEVPNTAAAPSGPDPSAALTMAGLALIGAALALGRRRLVHE